MYLDTFHLYLDTSDKFEIRWPFLKVGGDVKTIFLPINQVFSWKLRKHLFQGFKDFDVQNHGVQIKRTWSITRKVSLSKSLQNYVFVWPRSHAQIVELPFTKKHVILNLHFAVLKIIRWYNFCLHEVIFIICKYRITGWTGWGSSTQDIRLENL